MDYGRATRQDKFVENYIKMLRSQNTLFSYFDKVQQLIKNKKLHLHRPLTDEETAAENKFNQDYNELKKLKLRNEDYAPVQNSTLEEMPARQQELIAKKGPYFAQAVKTIQSMKAIPRELVGGKQHDSIDGAYRAITRHSETMFPGFDMPQLPGAGKAL